LLKHSASVQNGISRIGVDGAGISQIARIRFDSGCTPDENGAVSQGFVDFVGQRSGKRSKCAPLDHRHGDTDLTMTIERFNELLLEGPLCGTQRLAEALKYVVNGCGKQGELILEAWCSIREEKDREEGERWAEPLGQLRQPWR
jgi:hypothetical protein